MVKSVALVLVVLCLAAFAYGAEEKSGTAVKSLRQAKSFDGSITSGFITALSSIGSIGVLGLILLGALLLPSILSLLFATPGAGLAGGFGKRAFDGGFQVDKSSILARLSMLQEAWQKFDVKDPMCRKRLICEVHAIESELGPTARNLIKVMDYISNAGRFNLPEPMHSIIREYVESMRVGKDHRDCSKYSSCPYSIAVHMGTQKSV